MSLLFEHAVEQFAVDEASLYAATSAELTATDDDAVPVRPIADFASHYGSLTHPDEGWTCLPLHGVDSAAPTDEYVAYTDHPVRGELVLVERDGEYEPIDVDTFGRTPLAGRLRFWHSDYLPETNPPGYDAPIADREAPRHPVDSTRLVDEFAAYVADEREATRAAHRARAASWSAAAIYEQGGAAVPTVVCLGNDDGTYHFSLDCDEDRDDWAYVVEREYGIYQGNEVLLHATADGAPDAFPVAATVDRIRGQSIWLTVDWGRIDASAAVGGYLAPDREFGLSLLLNPVPFDRERDAVDALRDDDSRAVLAGERMVTFSNEAAARSDPHDDALNQEQQLAVEYALRADDLFCIHGPPGTGKTRTLLEIVRRAVDAGEDVLVCADSNQALDNLVAGASTADGADPQSLHAYGQHGAGEFTLDRVNAARSTRAVVREQYRDVANRGDVVAATNSSAATLSRTFDLLVLDEATQATCTASCIPLVRADRVVLAGDHHQLPPFSATEDPPASSYGLSLFEHLYADGGVFEGVGLQLKTQYRMHRDVAYFSNRQFYDRTLRNGRAVDPLDDRPAIEGYNVGGPVDVVDNSRANDTEARLVVHLVRQLLTDLPAAEIGVITPYVAQVDLVRRRLGRALETDAVPTVDTIDSFQGSERTAIVISLVRSNGDGQLGFLGRPADGPRRLNVALTRAKRYCAVVGDFHTLRYETETKCNALYQDFYDHFATTGRLNDVDPQFIPG